MVYTGKIENGVVRLDGGHELAEGTVVRVEEVNGVEQSDSGGYQDLLAHAGTIKGLPDDFARNHDHYIHGQPKE